MDILYLWYILSIIVLRSRKPRTDSALCLNGAKCAPGLSSTLLTLLQTSLSLFHQHFFRQSPFWQPPHWSLAYLYRYIHIPPSLITLVHSKPWFGVGTLAWTGKGLLSCALLGSDSFNSSHSAGQCHTAPSATQKEPVLQKCVIQIQEKSNSACVQLMRDQCREEAMILYSSWSIIHLGTFQSTIYAILNMPSL